LTGVLAGFTLALPDARIISVAGLVTGIAASLSMAASSFLETRQDREHGGKKQPAKSAFYTGTAYFITVLILIAPFFIFNSVFVALGVTLAAAILIIAIFNFYISVAKEKPFWKEFLTMAAISLGVAALSFGIAFLLRIFLGVDV
ncbi:rubrerythrin family protein, partial [Candidatus Woesearchaeota archaeon]|nr:rubrerythrin family protein [Candidatus Woesearchaeota archaeon]